MPETQAQNPEAEAGGRQPAKILNLEIYEPGQTEPRPVGNQEVGHLSSLQEQPPKPIDMEAARAREAQRQAGEHLSSLKEAPPKPTEVDEAQARMQAEARRKLNDTIAADPVVAGGAKILNNPGQYIGDDPRHERLARPDEADAARNTHKVRYGTGQHSAGQESMGRSMLKSLGRLVRRRKH